MNNVKKQDNVNKLKEAGLKVTHSRCKILELFQSSPDEHYTADKLKDKYSSVEDKIKRLENAGDTFGNSIAGNLPELTLLRYHFSFWP